MTSTPCRSAELDRIIASWVGKIVEFLATIVETILMIAENFRGTLQDLAAHGRSTGRWLMALCSEQFRPMMSKLGFLPPSASTLHALARESPSKGYGKGMKGYWKGY